MICFKKKVIHYLLLAQLLAVLSCGNLINDNVFGESTDLDDGKGIGFAELDRSFSDSGDVRIERVDDKGYYITGSVADDSAETTDNVWFALLQQNGNLSCRSLLRSGYDDRVRRAIVLDKENLLIFADRYYIDGDVDFIVVKVNRTNGIIWDYCFGNDKKNRVFDASPASDGGTVITGMSYYQGLLGMNYITFVKKLDANGTPLWEKNYSSLFSVIMPYEIKQTGKDEYFVSGVCLNRDTNKFKTFFSRINSAGEILASRYINAVGRHSMLIGTVPGTDGGFAGIISLTGTGDSDSIVFASFDREMNLLSVREFSFSGFNVRGRLVRGLGGGFIVAGLLNNNAGNGLYFLRFSGDGILKSLNTKYYDKDIYDLSEISMNSVEDENGILYICKYSNSIHSLSEGKSFIDKVNLNQSDKSSVSVTSRSTLADISEYETGEVKLTSDALSLGDEIEAGLVFTMN